MENKRTEKKVREKAKLWGIFTDQMGKSVNDKTEEKSQDINRTYQIKHFITTNPMNNNTI